MSRQSCGVAVLFVLQHDCLVSRHKICLQPALHVIQPLDLIAIEFSLLQRTFSSFSLSALPGSSFLCHDKFLFDSLVVSVATENFRVLTKIVILFLVTC